MHRPAGPALISTKPYLVRAIYEWCVDQGFTPYLTVVVDAYTRVPREHVRDGQITLNIAPEATSQLMMGNEEISFQARFSGVAFPVVVPVSAVSAIFASENGHGMAFDVVPTPEPPETEPTPEAPAPEPGKRPHLTRIK